VTVIDFVLPAGLEAHEPPEARGIPRDGVRMLVAAHGAVSHHRFTDLPSVLRAGDVVVVNTSGTLPAAVPVAGSAFTVHFSTAVDSGQWLVELRRGTPKNSVPFGGGVAGQRYALVGGGVVRLSEEYSRGRLWLATVELAGQPDVPAYLARFGAPIRYSYVPRPWPLADYQTVFASEPGSAEMPSAARPFTDRVVTRLVSAGISVVPILLHTGVASPEAHERPYPERFEVPRATATVVNAAKAAGGRIVAIGTTAVRALESGTGTDGVVRAASGWTELVVTPERGVRVVDGLLTGFHEPRASHLDMLAAIVEREVLDRCYAAALESGYLWHEFGDVHLLLP
jgi:S-adenosylmethionine:tRNA ribosyltransferase-isomerase